MILLGDKWIEGQVFQVPSSRTTRAATAAESRTPRALCKGAYIFGLGCVVIDYGTRRGVPRGDAQPCAWVAWGGRISGGPSARCAML
jgi:hypothetical protein